MPPSSTLWKLDGHTVGKHMVLEAYLKAWLPIILTSFSRATFVDGFAGPGEYSDGRLGSPMLAIDTFQKHRTTPQMTGSLEFIFVENHRKRAAHLERLVRSKALPAGSLARVYTDEFTDKMSELLGTLKMEGRQDDPMFVMVDPFGVSQTPMSIISRILQNSRSEVYISVMYEFINRFISIPEFSVSMDGLYGTPDWRQALSINDATERKDFLYGLYKSQLKKSGAKYVHNFDLYRGNELVYSLFFATRNEVGSDKMKQAMWTVDPFGNFEFRSSTLGGMKFDPAVSNPELGCVLIGAFGLDKQLDIEEIKGFMRSDKTKFHSGQLTDCLAWMEEQRTVEVVAKPKRRRRTFPKGTRITFVEPPPPSKQGVFSF